MSCKDARLTTHHQGDDRAGQSTKVRDCQPGSPLKIGRCAWSIIHLPSGGLSNFCWSFSFCCSRNDLLLGLTDLPARSFIWKERLNMLNEVEDYAV